jgi:hypothetical protein
VPVDPQFVRLRERIGSQDIADHTRALQYERPVSVGCRPPCLLQKVEHVDAGLSGDRGGERPGQFSQPLQVDADRRILLFGLQWKQLDQEPDIVRLQVSGDMQCIVRLGSCCCIVREPPGLEQLVSNPGFFRRDRDSLLQFGKRLLFASGRAALDPRS